MLFPGTAADLVVVLDLGGRRVKVRRHGLDQQPWPVLDVAAFGELLDLQRGELRDLLGRAACDDAAGSVIEGDPEFAHGIADRTVVV